MRRWVLGVVVVGLVAGVVGGGASPALAVGVLGDSDDLVGEMASPLAQSSTDRGQLWYVTSIGGGNSHMALSPTGAYAPVSGISSARSTYGVVDGGPVDGVVGVRVSYPARLTGEKAAVRLVFRSGTGGFVYLYASCTSAGGVLQFARQTGSTTNEVAIGTNVGAGMLCDSVHDLKVTYVGGAYEAFVDGVSKKIVSDPGTTSVPLTNTGVGVGVHEHLSSASGASRVEGLVMVDFEANGGAEPEVENVPYYRCGRTIRDLGGGTFFVDLEAGNAAYDDFTGVADPPYEDKRMWWQTSWGVESDTPGSYASSSKITLALPPLSEMPPGGWHATFSVFRESGREVLWAPGYFEVVPGERRTITNPNAGQPDISVFSDAWDLWDELPQGVRDVLAPEESATVDVTEWLGRLPNQSIWHPRGEQIGDYALGVVGTCTVSVNPLEPTQEKVEDFTGPPPPADPDDPPPTTSTTAPGSATTVPRSGYDDQGEDGTGSDCSAGFLGRIPIIGGAFELVARMVCAFKQLLIELFVPDDWGELLSVGEFSSKFPGSWVAEGTSGLTTLRSTVQGGVDGSACGPALAVPEPVSKTIRFPGPAGCGGSGSTVTTGDSAAFDLFGFRTPLRAVLTAMLYIGVVWRLLRLAPWTEGKDDGGPSV